jgi:phosphatidylserine/phosphatidylglycerophosphate/cardiolipin synthase-like enzyme
MRFKSHPVNGYQIFAVTGTNTVSFGIDVGGADTAGLLGFAVERVDPQENERYFLYGFKVFQSVIPIPGDSTRVTTFDHPVQSLVYDDFTAKPGHDYEYVFHPLKGRPKNLDRSAPPISIKVRMEPLFSTNEHDIFFNRGVASSQAYVREFGNKPPRDPSFDAAKQERALEWLSRALDDALLKFISNADPGDTLLGCFYEFRYRPAAQALRDAIARGVNVSLIVDAKVNESTDSEGVFHESFPREENLRLIDALQFPAGTVTLREAKPNDIQHNKFMVLLRGAARRAEEVWTGSTNLSDGGIHGQTNVGHWVRNRDVAVKYQKYWELLSSDPGPDADDSTAEVRAKNRALREAVEAILAVPPKFSDFGRGITPVFSPRGGKSVLEMYAAMVDQAKLVSCITLAFGISEIFKTLLQDNDQDSCLSFILLEKEDKPNPRTTKPFIALNARNNVYKAWGAFLGGPVYQWARETNARRLQLNQHVSYIHSKFLLQDPLSDDSIVVTGSANFSAASTNDNDENMIVIRGDQRVADIYFTEFNRLFFHYYFRSIQEQTVARLDAAQKKISDEKTLFLAENDGWVAAYEKPHSLKLKRVQMFVRMTRAVTL